MIGKTLSHYVVRERIGAGGMGVVYRARDERLQRDVAVKVLPEKALGDEDARRRFRQEALALSRINHPNIATIFDVGREDGVDFLVMEYIAGESVDERLAAGPMPEAEVVAIASELAAGLAAAHEQGVLHRDLKPANLRRTPDGRLKILDFGIAKVLRHDSPDGDAPTDSITQGITGTFPYMAPEQLLGGAVDARTDIHAVGAVMFEMATGRRAFAETQTVKLMDAILHHAPPPVRDLAPAISPWLEGIIARCLEKSPERRYQSARELIADLRAGNVVTRAGAPAPAATSRRRWPFVAVPLAVVALALGVTAARRMPQRDAPAPSAAATAASLDSLAVLPFVNRSPDARDEYLADGVTEELINALANTEGLRVVSRTSSFAFKGKNVDAREIGRTLDVKALLEGSVRKQEQRLRITAQLVRAADGYQIWSQTFDRQLDDVLAVQEEIARSIAARIRPDAAVQVARPTQSVEAYQLYLQARPLMVRNSIESLREALALLDQAIARDPQFAQAWVHKATTYRALVNRTGIPVREGLDKARDAARQALAIDPRLADAHAALGEILLSELKWDEAAESLARAVELNPNSAAAHGAQSNLFLFRGEHDKALAAVRRAYELDPVTRVGSVGRVLYHAGRYDEALSWFLRAMEAAPTSAVYHYYLGMTYAHLRREQDAVATMQKAVELAGDQRWRTHLAHVYVLVGRPDEARRVMAEVLAATPRDKYPRTDLAMLALSLGDREQALDWLEEAYQKDSSDASAILSDVELKPLYGEPRFQRLLRDLGLR